MPSFILAGFLEIVNSIKKPLVGACLLFHLTDELSFLESKSFHSRSALRAGKRVPIPWDSAIGFFPLLLPTKYLPWLSGFECQRDFSFSLGMDYRVCLSTKTHSGRSRMGGEQYRAIISGMVFHFDAPKVLCEGYRMRWHRKPIRGTDLGMRQTLPSPVFSKTNFSPVGVSTADSSA